MKSVRFYQFGDPAEVLRIEDIPRPIPGPGQLLVRILARPINPSDLLPVRGIYEMLPSLPSTPGLEGAGVVEAVGPAVRNYNIGQRVILLRVPGTWQEYILADESQVIPTPETISDATASQLIVNPFTAWLMTTEELELQPGQWLLQTAASSTLGRIVLQIARLRGFKTINVVRQRKQATELSDLGADEVICTEHENLVERVMELTGQQGVLAAIDGVGGEVGGQLLNVLGRGGTMLVYGLLSMKPITLHSGRMIFRTTTVRGFWLRDWFQQASPERQRAVASKLLDLMARGELIPPVEAAYDLKDVAAAVKHTKKPGRSGKILLVN